MQCQGGVSIFLYRHPWPRGREQFVLEPEERWRKDKQPIGVYWAAHFW
jgi:hypothetical protein